jgi:hypothetical protein
LDELPDKTGMDPIVPPTPGRVRGGESCVQ